VAPSYAISAIGMASNNPAILVDYEQALRSILGRAPSFAKVDDQPPEQSMKNSKGKTIAKDNLPSKICLSCNKAFDWRKKWARDWDGVIYCSDKCRGISKKT
jgi:hypothetical protein